MANILLSYSGSNLCNINQKQISYTVLIYINVSLRVTCHYLTVFQHMEVVNNRLQPHAGKQDYVFKGRNFCLLGVINLQLKTFPNFLNADIIFN